MGRNGRIDNGKAGEEGAMRTVLIAGVLGLLAPCGALARDNLAARPVNLDALVIGSDLKLSQAEYHLETGKAYRLIISTDGGEEFSWRAPEFFRNIWLDSVEVDDVSVTASGIYAINFEAEGEVTILFVPIRPGKYPFWVDGYENRGLAGAFVVD